MIALTSFFETEIGWAFPSPMDALDRELKGHVVFVLNQSLQAIRKEGISGKALETIGKLVFRLYQVMQAYRAKKRKHTLSQWIERVAQLGKELQDVLAL